MTDPATRRALRELLAKATPGPWLVDGNDAALSYWITDEDKIDDEGNPIRLFLMRSGAAHVKADAEFIAAARNALPELLDALDAAEAERERLRATLCSLLVSTDGVTDVGWEGVNRMRVLIADALGRGGSDGESEKFSREWWEARLGVPVKHYDEKMRMPYYDMNVLECWCGQPSAHESGGCAAHYRLVLDGQ